MHSTNSANIGGDKSVRPRPRSTLPVNEHRHRPALEEYFPGERGAARDDVGKSEMQGTVATCETKDEYVRRRFSIPPARLRR